MTKANSGMLIRPTAYIQGIDASNRYLFVWSMTMSTRASHFAAESDASEKTSGRSPVGAATGSADFVERETAIVTL